MPIGHMTIEEAVAELRCAGLEVSFGADGFAAAADRREPHPIVAAQGVRWVYEFGFGARRVGEIWFFRGRGEPAAPAEEYERLEDAVKRGLELFAAYRASQSTPAEESVHGGGMGRDERVDLDAIFAAFRRGAGEVVAKVDTGTHLDLAHAYAEMGLWQDARSELAIVLEREPKNADAVALLAVVEAELGEPPGSGPTGAA